MKCPVNRETGIRPTIAHLRELHEWVKGQNDLWAIMDLDNALRHLDQLQHHMDGTSDFFDDNPAPFQNQQP